MDELCLSDVATAYVALHVHAFNEWWAAVKYCLQSYTKCDYNSSLTFCCYGDSIV